MDDKTPGPQALRILIGFSARSASDDLVRALLPALSETLGRPVTVQLMPGELGALAARAAMSAAPDGHTLLVATFGTHAINPSLRPDLPYDPVADFAPVCLATRSPLVLGTRLSLAAGSVQELVALSRREALSFGSSGVGSAPYLAGLLFQRITGGRLVHRPYPDTRVLYEDLLAGRLDLSFNNAASMLPPVREGRLRALAVTTATRSAAASTLPTLAECGLDGFALGNWLGFVAPRGTPATVVDVLNRALVDALNRPATRESLVRDGIDVIGSPPGAFAEAIVADIARWAWLRDEPVIPA